jgi:transposase
MLLKYCGEIFIYNKSVDMRKQIDGLQILVSSQLGKDPGDGSLYIFYNRNFDKLKILFFEEGGYCLFYKRLSKGRFKLGSLGPEICKITSSDLHLLLAGLSLKLLCKKAQEEAQILY